MNTNSSSQTMSKRLIELPSGSYKLLLYSLPPLHFYYLFVVTKHLLSKQNRSDLFLIMYFFGFIISSLTFIFFYFVSLTEPIKNVYSQQIMLWSALLLISLYLFFLMQLSFLTIQHERSRELHRFFDFTDLDYINRFFSLLFLPFCIWNFQSKIQEVLVK
jgi:hypothetical protein